MTAWQNAVIRADATIRDAIRSIAESSAQIAVVCDDQNRLLGAVTDGDVRRGLLRDYNLDTPVDQIMERQPVTAPADTDPVELLRMMREHYVHQVPLLSDGRIVEIAYIDELIAVQPARDNWVVLMAGGEGTRLRPMTEDLPKPLIPVGAKPILETIIENFVENGFRKFFITLHYKADAIIHHFGDGSRFGASITYVEESDPRGTAGALKLLPEKPTKPLIVMNGDLLTRVDFSSLIQFHETASADLTMCVRNYEIEVPFGVVEIENDRISRIDEKPIQKFLVNAGIYVLGSHTIDMVPDGTRFDMPSLFEMAIQKGMTTTSFPIHEYWIDVGRLEDLNQANVDFDGVFRQ
jgi:dTDP-glucose pyrophosphorylase